MIGLRLALSTEILGAIIASDSVLGEVLSSFPGNGLTLVVLLAHLHFARFHLHHVAARTANKIGILLDEHHELALINLLLVIIRQKLPALEVHDLLLAAWAAHRLGAGHLLDDLLPEAVDVNLVEAFGRLEHVQVLVDLVVLRNKLVAQHAQTVLPHLLHLLVDCRRPLLLVRTQERVHVVSLDVALRALAHILVEREWLLLEEGLGVGLLMDLHVVVLVFLQLVEWDALVGFRILSLTWKCATSSRLRHIHGENGPQVLYLAVLRLTSLNAHRAHERFQGLRERCETFLLHFHAFERVVMHACLVPKRDPASAAEATAAHLARLVLHEDGLLHAAIRVHKVVKTLI